MKRQCLLPNLPRKMISWSMLLVLAAVGPALADDQPQTSEANPPTAAASDRAKPGETFTTESLGIALDDMGYDAKLYEFNGAAYYDFPFTESGITAACRVEIAPDNKTVWLKVFVATIQKDDAVPTAVLLGLIDANRKGFCYFESYPQKDGTRNVWVTTQLPNHHLTRVELRNRIKTICLFTSETAALWQRQYWAPPPPPTFPPPAPASAPQ